MSPIGLRTPHPKRVERRGHPLVREFRSLMDEQRVGVTDVAERAGIGTATIVKWSCAHSPTVVALEAALNVLGYRLAIVPADGGSR